MRMGNTDYILRHPRRVFVREKCDILKKEDGIWKLKKGEEIVIPVDDFSGNQDPYVYHNPWLTGLCHNYTISGEITSKGILTWGTWVEKSSSFLVDTVFIVREKYRWLGAKGDFQAEEIFRNKYPYKTENGNKLYKEFIEGHRDEHQKAKNIFVSSMYNEDVDGGFNGKLRRADNLFSFMPLNLEGGIYRPIDVFDIVKLKDQEFTDILIKKKQNGCRNIINEGLHIMNEIFKRANILVIKVYRKGSPGKVEEELQREYYREIYHEDWNEKKKKRKKC